MSHKKKLKKKIGPITRPKPNIPEQKPNYSDQVYIDLTYYHNWTHSINEKYFVNSLKDAEEAARYFYFIINTLLPDLESMGKDIFSGKYKHCHRIDGEKIKVARKIVKKIHNLDLSGDEDLWQLTAKMLGVSGLSGKWYIPACAVSILFSLIIIITYIIDPAIIADNLPRPRVAQYFNDLLKTKSYSTVNVRRSALAGMYKYGVTYGYIKNNPVDKLTLNKPKQRKAKDITDKYLTDDEYKRLIDQFIAEGRDDYADFFQFLYYTGLRRGEAACLTYSDFHKRGGQWYVTIDGTLVKRGHDGTVGDYYKQKGAKTAAGNRVIFVPSPAMAIVKRHKQSRPFLFLNAWSGGPMVIENVNHVLLTTSKRAKIKKRVTSHFFRHTHVSKLAEQGVPLDVIEQRVGHSGTKTIVDIYEHITRNSEQKLETALGQI